jgi:hypothetical protein
MLEAGRAVIREPIDEQLRVRNLESEHLGANRNASCVVVGARYDVLDVSPVVMLLAVFRALASRRTPRTVRFVALAGGTASQASAIRYAQRLRATGARVHAAVSLGRVSLSRERTARLMFAGTLRSWSFVATARAAFRAASRIPCVAVPSPPWLPALRESDYALFTGQGWPAIMVTDGLPWAVQNRNAAPDVDSMVAAVPGLTAALEALAGGEL